MKRYKVGNTSGSARGRLANKATLGGHPRGYRRRGSTLASGNARRPEDEHACASSESSDLQNPRPPFAQFTRARGAPPFVLRCDRLTYIQRNLARGFDLHQLTVNAARSFSFALSRTPLLVLLPYLNARNDGVCPSKKRASRNGSQESTICVRFACEFASPSFFFYIFCGCAPRRFRVQGGPPRDRWDPDRILGNFGAELAKKPNNLHHLHHHPPPSGLFPEEFQEEGNKGEAQGAQARPVLSLFRGRSRCRGEGPGGELGRVGSRGRLT